MLHEPPKTKSTMSVVPFLLFFLCAAFSAHLWKQNVTLFEELQAVQHKLNDLNKESDLNDINFRINAIDTRAGALERLQRASAADLNEVLNGEIKTHDHKHTEEALQVMRKQVNDLGSKISMHSQDIGTVSKSLNALSANTLKLDDGMGICVLAGSCPTGFTRTGTFGTILHNPDQMIGAGMKIGSNFGNGWDWLHGSLCCKNARKLDPKPAAVETKPAAAVPPK